MENIDILKRLRYALDIKDADMVEIFRLGGEAVTKEEVKKMLLGQNASDSASEGTAGKETSDGNSKWDNHMLESFLNGFIIFKRGKKEANPGESEKQPFMINDDKDVNNVLLKKLKIALSLTGEDMLAVFKAGGVELSNGELSAVLRRQGQRNYKICGDRYARTFLKGLALKYRR